MSSSAKITWLIGILIIASFAIAAQFVSVRQRTTLQAAYTVNAGELTRDVLVGQTFRSSQDNLSAVSVLFATYSNRLNTQPIHFHLRQSLDATENLRTASVIPAALGDNQFFRFEFTPIPDSGGKTYFFFVTSPESTPGNAVTIDVDSRNPYHLGTAFIVRGQGPQITDPAALARSGKPTQDIGFEVYHTVPLRVAVVHSVRSTIYTLISTWDQRRSQYVQWSKAAIPALAFMLIAYMIYRRSLRDPNGDEMSRRTIIVILLALIALAISLRLMYAAALPFTEDEGNYLYDARTLREGTLAGGDGYVKSPLSIAWLALGQFVGGSLLVGRLSSIIIGALTLYPIYTLGRLLKNRYTGLLAAAAWALVGAAAVFNIYIHTQPVALFFGISGLAVLWRALRRGDVVTASYGIPQRASATRQLLLAGILLGLGVASRKSILAMGIVPVVLIIFESTSWRQRIRNLMVVGVGFTFIIGAFLSLATWFYGREGLVEALGINSATDGIATRDASEIANERAYSLRGMTPFFRESLPLILLSLIGWGYLLENVLRRGMQRIFSKPPAHAVLLLADHFVPKLGWLPVLLAFAWCMQFFFEYEGATFMFYGMPVLWYAMAATVALVAVWPRSKEEGIALTEKPAAAVSTQPAVNQELPPNVVSGAMPRPKRVATSHSALLPLVGAALFLPAWVGGLAFFYVNWIKFHANYLSEFIPPVVVLSGVGMLVVWQRLGVSKFFLVDHPIGALVRRFITLLVLATITWALFLSNYITYIYEHTGTFHQASTRQAAEWAKANIPLDEPIFTGASLVTYLSGHHNALNISHPRWYAYEDIRTDTTRLTTFMPAVEDMLQAYRDSQWFLLDKQTGFAYLMEYSEIERGLQEDFEVVQEIENGSNTLTFYRRVK